MNKLKSFIISFTIFLLSCATSKMELTKPKDYSNIIKKIENSKINSNLKRQIVNTIHEQQNYSNQCYSKILELEERLNDLEAENEQLKKDKAKLKEKLQTWLAIKTFFWIGVVVLVLAIIIRFLYPIIKPIVRLPI